MIQWVVVKRLRLNLPGLADPTGVPSGRVTRSARVGLDVLAAFNAVAQAVLVIVLFMGAAGAKVAPIAGGAVVALFLLMYFYGRWMLPFLKGRHVLLVVLVRELGVFILVGLAVGVTLLIRWLAGI